MFDKKKMVENVDEPDVEEPEADSTAVLQDIREHMADLRKTQGTREMANDSCHDEPGMPEDIGASVLKYHKSAEVAGKLEDQFESNVSFFGSHVVNSNTKRMDNLRHLGELDSTRIVRDIPYLRESGTDIKIETTSEYQMCRSNPEIGGFDQKMGRTNITKEDVDLRQQQTINKGAREKSGGILGFFGRKKAS